MSGQHLAAAPWPEPWKPPDPILPSNYFMAFRLKGTFIDRGIEKEQSTVGAKSGCASACHCAGRKGVAEGGGVMKKIVCLLKRREGLSFEAFKDYYENNHTKIFTEFLQTPGGEALRAALSDTVVQSREVWFDNEQLYQGFVGGTMDPKFRDLVIADEEKLFDRSQMFFHGG
jgi:hypothetical protein